MLRTLAARAGVSLTALVLSGAAYAAIPAGSASALLPTCPLAAPQARATVTVGAPYGVSARVADLLTVKVINTTSTGCDYPTVTIYPREGFVFNSIVSTTGGWTCEGPGVGVEGPTVCTADEILPYSSTTIRVQYNRAVPNGPVSGTASAELSFDYCKRPV